LSLLYFQLKCETKTTYFAQVLVRTPHLPPPFLIREISELITNRFELFVDASFWHVKSGVCEV